MGFINKREAEKAEKKAILDKEVFKDYIQQNEAFLAKNKEKAGVVTTESGLQYEVIKMGTGPKPTRENTVKVHYAGTLIDGTEFDSSIKRNEPAQFPVGGVIAGWTEALQLMPVGSKFKLYLPSAIAYGATGAGEVIKPYSTLIFEVELLEIVQ
jgi:FKBP-type peptidyl-prolyl cis-trans isomerase FklB